MLEGKNRSMFTYKVLVSVLCLIVLAAVGTGIFYVGNPPEITIDPKMPVIGMKTPVRVEISAPRRGLTHVKIEIVQGDSSALLLEKTYPSSSSIPFIGEGIYRDEALVEAGRQNFPELKGGSAVIRVTAGRAGTWLRSPDPVTDEITLPVQLTPPSLQVTSIQTNVAQGGSEVVTYRVGETSVRDGVRAGSWWFPGFALPGGGPRDRFALFAIPHDMTGPEARLTAEDAAGNVAERTFIDNFSPRMFRSDQMGVSDAFLNKVVPEILSQSPEITEQGTLVDSYILINRELRRINDETLKNLSRNTSPSFLWTRNFIMMPNSKVTALFGDRRTYLYEEKEIDHQVHLGIDLASVRQAPIPAANSGRVVYAGYLGIYGITVVIDHGYGLQTIYGHLSSVDAVEGQDVARGDIIGRTGETGLAGGDHLHYGVLLHGLPVNPLEWSDGQWIRNRIGLKLGPSFVFIP
ncbi:MAG TPA: M23 family metallopeptidase [Acidobacteriota bacterium]|nr:M23 family metallopeptidase [Acidobacteriota bacterium]